VDMTGGYDEMSGRSYPDYPGGTSLQRWHRDLLRRSMEAEGFTVYEAEWWHFDDKDWKKYRIENRASTLQDFHRLIFHWSPDERQTADLPVQRKEGIGSSNNRAAGGLQRHTHNVRTT